MISKIGKVLGIENINNTLYKKFKSIYMKIFIFY